MSDHTDTTLTDTERDSLTECECGHYLNEHSSDGCLANDDDGDLCVCMATPDLIRERAIVAIVAARVAAARANERARIITNLYKHSARLTSTFGPGTAAFDLGRYTEGAWFACVAEWIEGADQ